MEFDAKTAIIIGFFCKPEEKEANRKCFCYACAFPLTVRSLSRFEIYNSCLVICQLCWNFLLGKLCWPEVKFHFLRNARKIGPRALKILAPSSRNDGSDGSNCLCQSNSKTRRTHYFYKKNILETSRKYQGNAKFSFSDIAIAFFVTGKTRAEKCTSLRAPVAQLVEHRAVTREVVSSTPAGPTFRVLK